MIRKVENREAHPSAADWYWAVEHEGVRLLLTDREYEAARRRAAKNPEDFEIEVPTEPEPPEELPVVEEPEPPAPPPPPTGAKPVLVEEFGASITQLRSAPHVSEVIADGGTISTEDGRLRFDWRPVSSPARGGSIGLGLKLANTPEAWLELEAALSPGFKTENGYSGGAALKFFGLRYRENPPSGRIDVGFVGDQLTFNGPGDIHDASFVRTGLRLADLADGQMHSYRLHARLGDAFALELWVDGHHFASRGGLRTGARTIYGAWLGKNINQAPLAPQWQLWDNVRVFTQNPGW